jgi:hypothetical protein
MKMSQTGPHIKKHEQMKEGSTELAKLEKEFALQKKEHDISFRDIRTAPHESKAIPSTYFPPEPQHENQRKASKGGLHTFQPPMHG